MSSIQCQMEIANSVEEKKKARGSKPSDMCNDCCEEMRRERGGGGGGYYFEMWRVEHLQNESQASQHRADVLYFPNVTRVATVIKLTFSFLSSVSRWGIRTFDFTEPSLKISPKPIPWIFLGCTMAPLPEAGCGDDGVTAFSTPWPSVEEMR